MQKDLALVTVIKGGNRACPDLVAVALEALDRVIPPRDWTRAQNLSSLQDDVVQTRISTKLIFDVAHLKRVADGIDSSAERRRSRDDTKEIALHDKLLPDEHLKYWIFHFANRVCCYSRLSEGLCGEVIKNCAAVLFHDRGYKSVQGISRLDKTWQKRMEDSYHLGSDNHPLCGHYKGARRYTDRFDDKNQGCVLKYFGYAQKAIGNQASWADLAACMNRKAELDNCTVGGKKATFNSSNLYVPVVPAVERQGEVFRGKARLSGRDEEGVCEMVQELKEVDLQDGR